MKFPRSTSLYWRLFTSYLLVIIVGSATLLGTGEVFGRSLAEKHAESMELTSHDLPLETAQMLAEFREAYRRAFRQSLFWGSLVATLVAGGVGLFITSQIVSPLRYLQRASRRVALGQYGARRHLSAPGEIGELNSSFNDMILALNDAEAR